MKPTIKVIIGLGNPGQSFYKQRHNIGFRVVDMLADKYHAQWQKKGDMEITQIPIQDRQVYLVKPQTYMNTSGKVLDFFVKKGIKPEEILVVHDELELPFGKVVHRHGGSARGHNGLKSIISFIGDQFHRLRVGISRPADKADVADYVLAVFEESEPLIEQVLEQGVVALESIL